MSCEARESGTRKTVMKAVDVTTPTLILFDQLKAFPDEDVPAFKLQLSIHSV